MSNQIELLISDIGGVVIKLDFSHLSLLLDNEGPDSIDDYYARFNNIPEFDFLEKGKIDDEEFLEALNLRCGLTIHRAQFKAAWAMVLSTEIPGMRELFVACKGAGLQVVGLSNTNPPHLALVRKNYPAVRELTGLYASCELGMRKPSRGFYLAPCECCDVAPSRALYVDDRMEYVQAAKAAGLNAVHFIDAPSLATELRNRGVDLPQLMVEKSD